MTFKPVSRQRSLTFRQSEHFFANGQSSNHTEEHYSSKKTATVSERQVDPILGRPIRYHVKVSKE